MNRRDCIKTLAALFATLGCERESISMDMGGTSAQLFNGDSPFASTITIDPSRPGLAANPALLGSNVQWVDGGDGLLPSSGTQFIPQVLDRVKQLAPTVIRYPGGSQSDVYHWGAGVGPESQRGTCEHFHRKDSQVVRFGTAEFLALCETTGAVPLITVNVATGTPQEAADWVRAINVAGLTSPLTGLRLPKVIHWEIGNEPYLKENNRPETWMEPEEYAARANAFITAMRHVDPSIQLGIPLRSDTFNGIPVTPHQGFNEKVLPLITETYDFVSLHNAYFPFLYADVPSDAEIYAGLMAASETVRFDLDATRTQLNRLLGRTLPLAITEYNALVTLGKGQDHYLASPAGALYVADLLRLFAAQPDIVTTDHWSLIGNWYFGSLTSQGTPRPSFDVLRLYRNTLRGRYLPATYATKTFSAPRIGLMRDASNLAVVTGTVTLDAGKLRLLLLNKDPQASSQATINLTKGKFGPTVTTETLAASTPFANPDAADAFLRGNGSLKGDTTQLSVTLPPCSLTSIETQLA